MPRLSVAGRLATPEVGAVLVHCDGHDAARPESEQVEDDRVWIILAGRFAWRDRRRRAVADPTTFLVLRAGEPFEVRHPHGSGDVCLSVAGAAARRALGDIETGGQRLEPAAFARWSSIAHQLRAGRRVDALVVEEALVLGMPGAAVATGARRERDIADAIAYELQLRIDEPVPLAELAAAAGVSIFHACRVFRRVRGISIHQHRQAVRLRHALALVQGSDRPLAQVAAECGYASQAHMTNQFGRRLGVTPAAARRRRN